MDVGMLWFDKDVQAGMADKVGKVAEFYKKKYGKQPNICYVNPKMLEEDNLQIAPWRQKRPERAHGRHAVV